MPEILTTKEIAEYLKLHEITVCKHAAEGKIPAIRIGRVWRFNKDAIDEWIAKGQNVQTAGIETAIKQKKKSSKKPKRRKREV